MTGNYLEQKICPICSQKVEQSEYQNQVFKNEPEVNYQIKINLKMRLKQGKCLILAYK